LIEIVMIDEFKDIDFTGKIFITGFHGVGATGYITIRHMVDNLPVEKIGYLIPDFLPGFVSIENERLSLPFEFYLMKDYVFFLPRSQPGQSEVNEFIRVIAEFVIEKGFKESMLIGGLDNKFQTEDDVLKTVPTRPFLDQAKNMGPLLDKGLYVTGPLALLLELFELKNFPACAILPYAERERPDPRAAAVAIKAIDEHYNNDLNVEIEDLYKDAKRIEEEIENILSQERELEKGEKPLEPGSRGMYV